jgi:ectoine hydroxylase-related dioxygenase (phytanoyl-CoA dioxygenase family)
MDGEFQIEQLGTREIPEQAKAFWREHGYIVLKNAAPRELIERVNVLMDNHRRKSGESKDAQGFGDRVGMLHQRSPDCLRLAAQPNVMNFLRWAMDDDPLLMGSLNFEKGTQQDEHIDSIFFYTEPMYAMCGVWFALEDVHEDAGPLFYGNRR